jgi:acetolactate synthase-1/2/3 large subunit
MKYSDQIAIWLKDNGFTHFFYVGGGNIMHLTESLSNHLKGVPVIHEVAAVIASEYFNAISENNKSIVLVTAGPGLTNTITGIAGSWLENRFVLIFGGQVKTTDLKNNSNLRQRGIQEINGFELVKSICKVSERIDNPISKDYFLNLLDFGSSGKKGPVFLEFPLDVQAVNVSSKISSSKKQKFEINNEINNDFNKNLNLLLKKYSVSKKPIILIGGGVSYNSAVKMNNLLPDSNVPLMTTYNGADRVDGNYKYYFGRPNTWGQRSSNILIQKSDLIIVFGSRLGLQQTGFNWQEFGRYAEIIQIDIDSHELDKGHPKVEYKIQADCNSLLISFLKEAEGIVKSDWLNYCNEVRSLVPRVENINVTGDNYISPYDFILNLEEISNEKDIIIPCSSGSAFTLTMQLWNQKFGQRILTNKSLASMGYGLSGAIGASIAFPDKRTILIEGDGGFAQNIQEVGTAKINNLNLKIFIFHDQGHASIRMTQKNYFKGKYLGCDFSSGLGLPDWTQVFKGWNINILNVNRNFHKNDLFLKKFNRNGLDIFIVNIDPDQTYLPKISSRVTSSGSMESNPIDKMSPEIDYLKEI